MKILHLSNCYYNCGGDCTYLFNLKRTLAEKGHENIVFSMHHPQNFASEYSKYFVSHINYAEEVKNKTSLSGIKVMSRALYSFEAKKKIDRLISKDEPDIAHIQSLHHHLTYSVLYPLKKRNIPIVWTLHDYALICPNTTFLNHGQICEKCKVNKYYRAVTGKCKKDSYGATTVAVIETILHKIMRIHDMVDVFITPSEFLRNKLIEYGFNGNKVICLNNFIDVDSANINVSEGDYCLYAGRLEREKGVRTLIDAAVKAGSGKLKIAGDGTLREELTAYVESKNASGKIEFLGHRSHEEVMELIRNCRFVVLPSEWYENFPFAVLEAFACGKTVIGSKIGGIPEMVRDNETGLTFEMGKSDDLSSKIKHLWENPHKAAEMGKRARVFVEQELSAEKHYQKLMEIYKTAIK